MLLVQEFLKKHTFKDLAEQHGVYCSFSKSGHKWSASYDQIEAKDSDPLSQQCRGLILACEDGKSLSDSAVTINGKLSYDHICPGKTRVLSRSMDRFFNLGQGFCAAINWNDPKLKILSKLDGTLIILYYDHFTNKWCAATRSAPDADIIMDNQIYTFRTLFEKALLDTTGLTFEEYTSSSDRYTSTLNKEITYCFELCTPLNNIVVKYKDYSLTLIAARSIISFEEINLNYIPFQEVPIVHAHTYTSVSELVEYVSTFDPMKEEGVVAVDSNFNRIKIKSPTYVLFHKMRDSLGSSPRNCLDLILLEKDDDALPFLPEEIVANLLKIKAGLKSLISSYDSKYAEIKALSDTTLPGDKKTFALNVKAASEKNKLWEAPLYKLYANKANNMHDFLLKNKNSDGSFSNSFLDKILELL